MLSYRHAFHAGNFADVFKHVLLVQLIRALHRKDKPFCVLDTHAGAGIYRLDGGAAQTSGEAAAGIARMQALWAHPAARDWDQSIDEVEPEPMPPSLVERLIAAIPAGFQVSATSATLPCPGAARKISV